MNLEFCFTIGMALFGVLFIVWMFAKSFSDLKKEKAILTDIYRDYGVKTTAEIIYCRKHINTQRTMPYKYELLVEFSYASLIKKGSSCPCLAKILTNNLSCKKYENFIPCKNYGIFIPIVYIPQYADYVNEFADSKKLCQNIGIKVYQYSDKMIILADDISVYTNLSEI